MESQIPDASGISSKEQAHQSHSRKCQSADKPMGEKLKAAVQEISPVMGPPCITKG
jgi:hypothetical protein